MPVILRRLVQFSLQLYKETTGPVFRRGSFWGDWWAQGQMGVLLGIQTPRAPLSLRYDQPPPK